MGVDCVHNTWPKSCLMIKCISLPCLSSVHCLSSRSCLGANQQAIINIVYNGLTVLFLGTFLSFLIDRVLCLVVFIVNRFSGF